MASSHQALSAHRHPPPGYAPPAPARLPPHATTASPTASALSTSRHAVGEEEKHGAVGEEEKQGLGEERRGWIGQEEESRGLGVLAFTSLEGHRRKRKSDAFSFASLPLFAGPAHGWSQLSLTHPKKQQVRNEITRSNGRSEKWAGRFTVAS